MANTLTSLFPTLYAALDTVSREYVGFTNAVSRDSRAERAALNQTVMSPVVPAATAADNTPGTTAPDTGDQTIGNVTVTISKSKHVPIRWNGEEQRGMNTGPGYRPTLQRQFEQAFRTLVNLIEVDMGSLYYKASRAYGTAGTTPFGTANELDDAAEVLRILAENGAPNSDLHMVLDAAAIAKLRGYQSVLFKVNEAGTDDLLRRGIIGDLQGLMLHQSAGVAYHTKGTATGFDANGGEPVGETTIVVDGSDSGTILAGDIVTWAGDTNKYLVQSATASGAATGNIVIAEPGLRSALATTVEGTIGASYRANMAFHRDAVVLATRAPARPAEGDMADDVTIVTDPVSGLSFEIAIYKQFRQVVYHVSIAWGYQIVKPEHVALLIG